MIPFEPPKWAADSHIQTILGDILPSAGLRTEGKDILVQTHDGDKLLCRLHVGESPFVFVICHGLTGSSEAAYVQRMTNLLGQQNHTICRMNHRSCGDGLGHASGSYHAGNSDDIARVTFELRQMFPKKKIVCISYSLSGNIALLLSAGVLPTHSVHGVDHFNDMQKHMLWSMPDYAIAVNPPVNLVVTTEAFTVFFNKFYQWNFIRSYRRLMKDLSSLEILEEQLKIRPSMSIREFDELYTSKRSGHNSALDYYEACSAQPHMSKVAIPFGILTSEDDPFVEAQQLHVSQKSDLIDLHVEKHGGHMGFLSKEKTPYGNNRWMDYAVYEIFKEISE